MKLLDYILLSLAAGFLIIGISEIFAGNFKSNYWIFMLMIMSLLLFTYRKGNRIHKEDGEAPIKEQSAPKPKKAPQKTKKKKKRK